MQIRTHQVLFRLSEKEYAQLCKKVQKSNMKREQYIRSLINGFSPKEAPPADYYKLICAVRKAGANVNQLLKVANSITNDNYWSGASIRRGQNISMRTSRLTMSICYSSKP